MLSILEPEKTIAFATESHFSKNKLGHNSDVNVAIPKPNPANSPYDTRKICHIGLYALAISDTVANNEPKIVAFCNPKYSVINEKGTLNRNMTARCRDPIEATITVEQSKCALIDGIRTP